MVTVVYVVVGRFYGLCYGNHGRLWIMSVDHPECEMVFTVGFLVISLKKRVHMFLFITIICDQQLTHQENYLKP